MAVEKKIQKLAEKVAQDAALGLIEVKQNGAWRPFLRLSKVPLGSPWDRVIVIGRYPNETVAIEHTPLCEYEVEFRLNGRTDKWKKLLDESRKNPPNTEILEFRTCLPTYRRVVSSAFPR